MWYNTNIWKDDRTEQQYNKAYSNLDTFFEELYHHNNGDTTNISGINFNDLIYREGQNSYALDIMEAIKNKHILLTQAGVGIGKSFGYLLPIFYTYNNVETFNKVIISTSSIALQEQLLKDIKRISKMLNIDIKADIAKGVNNYACLKRIYNNINKHTTTPENKQLLEELAGEIEKEQTSDKSDLKQMSENIWKKIQLQSRGYCSNCSYSRLCPFYKKQQTINTNNIIITNHANMARSILDNNNIAQNLDMIVFDEAHKLEENMKNIKTGEIKLFNIINQLDQICSILLHQYKNNIITSIDSEDNEITDLITELKNDIELLFSNIRASASRNFFDMKQKTNSEDAYSIKDANRLSFRITPTVKQSLNKIIEELDILFNQISIYEKKNATRLNVRVINQIKEIYLLFKDMIKKEESTNIYWADFYKDNKITILYTPKDNLDITKSIFSKEIPIICTSGTLLDNKNSYNYFNEGLGLNRLTNITVEYGDEQKSPYDYANNSLFYYNPNLSNPKDKDNYIRDLAIEINELIRMTNGKALILFTSKEAMNQVYELLQTEEYPFDILLHTDTNTNEIKEHFKNDVNSCLFATGAFWEGIDIKGESLSNLIITRLPFDQVDAITQYKASKYSKREQFREVYFPNMLLKFKQAIGRLIRSDNDTGIVCCLDSRFANYQKAIIPNVPMTNYTTDKKELYQFVENKILDQKNNYTKKKVNSTI